MRVFSAISVSLVMLAACGGPVALREDAGDAIVVARFGDVTVTAAEVDARVLVLPPAQRARPGQDLDSWYEEQIRELVVESSLRLAAVSDKVDEQKFYIDAQQVAEKQFAVQLCLAEMRPEINDASDEELHAFYESYSNSFAAPERRAVYHIFCRSDADATPASARKEMVAIRNRVLGGESFQRLATAHSDSESRHREGSLGWLIPGQLPGGFDDTIFGLVEGVPSEPVETRDGVHIFFVDQILPARQLSFDEARSMVHKQVLAERREAVLAELEAEVELPPAAIVLDRAGFDALAKAGDQDVLVFRINEIELTLGELRRQLRQTLALHPAEYPVSLPDLTWKILEQYTRREVLYSYCQVNDKIPASELEARLASWQEQAMVDLYRNRRLQAIALRDEVRLQLFYESNIGLFSMPPKWRVRRLQIPITDSARAVMARLEQAAIQPGMSLDMLRDELGGEIEILDFRSQADLRRLQPKLPSLIAPLAVGELSPPYRGEDTLEIVEVMDCQAAEPLPFEKIRERVAAAYVQQYTRELYQELVDEILGTAELEILPEGIAALREASLMRPDISVEELEALLNEL